MIAALQDAGRLHAHAVKALLDVGMPGGVTVYLGAVPDAATYPHVVVYPLGDTADRNGLTVTTAALTYRFQATGVGRGFDEASGVLDWARAVLVGAKPAVSGWTCNSIVNDGDGQPVRESPSRATDPTTGLVLCYGALLFTCMSSPA